MLLVKKISYATIRRMMSDQTLLSFCIPTYNFGKFIGETLASIVPQMQRNMEIVIVDGGSKDRTEEIVTSFQKSYPNIHYHKCEQRGGIDRDIALAISLAKGKYCWLFSADDVLKRGAVNRFISKIEQEIDVYLVGVTLCGLEIRNVLEEHLFSKICTDQVIDLSNQHERLEYFEKAETSTAFFSFMSALIIDRQKWEATEVDERFYGSCWAHVARLFSMVPQGCKLKFLPEPYLMKRGGNDSFMEHGVAHRVAMSIEGFCAIGETLFGLESREFAHFRRVVKNEFTVPALLGKKLQVRSKKEKQHLGRLVKKQFSDFSFKNRCSYFLYASIPIFFLPILKKIWKLKKILKIKA